MADDPCLMVGAVLGDSDPESMQWSREIGSLATELLVLQAATHSALRLNVVFHVNGRLVPNEFAGVRLGRYGKHKRLLVVQAAVEVHRDTDRRAVLTSLLEKAILEAEQYAVRKGLADGLPELRQLVSRIS